MNLPEIFKYGTLVSYPLFAVIFLFLIKKTPDFSFEKQTVSKSINYIKNPFSRIMFRLNFALKALLDLCFTFYVLERLKIFIFSPIGIVIILSIFLFGALAGFVEGKHTIIHNFLIYSYMALWAIGQILIAFFIGSISFTIFTVVFLTIPLVIGFWSLYKKTTNALIQALVLFFVYSWLIVFVFKYL